MLKTFWKAIVASLVLSYVMWFVANQMVPPMIDAVPNLQWTGVGASLVVLSQFVVENPVVLLIWPIIVVWCSVFGYKKFNPEKCARFAVILRTVCIWSCVLFIGYVMIASFSMQDQLTSTMGV